jgi:quercetin dioxygenase-like cupin family protein
MGLKDWAPQDSQQKSIILVLAAAVARMISEAASAMTRFQRKLLSSWGPPETAHPRARVLSDANLLNKTTVCPIIHSNKGIAMNVVKIAELAKEPQKSPLFTGPVTMQTIVGTELSRRFMIRQVNFASGVRNKFHSHSIEQVLIVTEGKGIVANEKEEKTVVPGDVVFIAAGEKHWHGAAEGATFSHIYIMSPDQSTTQLEP